MCNGTATKDCDVAEAQTKMDSDEDNNDSITIQQLCITMLI